ncbi:MAG: phosphodiester glycosidase family protein [Gemmatimonadota bacterium]
MLRITLLLLLLTQSPLNAQRATLSVLSNGELLALSRITEAVAWRDAQPGLRWGEVQLRAGSWQLPVRAIMTRVDPHAFDLELALATKPNGMTGVWSLDSTPHDAAFALNAGQFKETGPWGWLVMNGYEKRDPGYGPHSAGIAIDTAGAVRWIAPAQLAAARRDRSIRFAFQSYPLLLFDGAVPSLLLASDDVDRTHRDARLMLAQLRDSTILIVLTRYDGLGVWTERVPIGLTVPESLELMRALGAHHAVMLDGGISAQLLLRTADGVTHKWSGLRDVPLALIARPRKR